MPRKSDMRRVLTLAAALLAGLAAEGLRGGGFIIPQAQAVIGRPLTPLSYAGVARRTTRRMIYATSTYVAVLPAGCRTVVVEGTALQQCGATYYQPAGGRYVVVRVE